MTEAELNSELWKLFTAEARYTQMWVPLQPRPPADPSVRVPHVFRDKIRIAEEDLVRTDHPGRRHVKECLNRIAQLKTFEANYPYTVRLDHTHRTNVGYIFQPNPHGIRQDLFEWLDDRYPNAWARLKEFIGFKDDNAAFEFRMRWC